MVVIHLCVKLSVFAVSMATAGIFKFPSLKTIYTHAIQHFYYVSSNSEHFKLFTFFCGNCGHSEISKHQNYVLTCQTKFLESFIQFRAL